MVKLLSLSAVVGLTLMTTVSLWRGRNNFKFFGTRGGSERLQVNDDRPSSKAPQTATGIEQGATKDLPSLEQVRKSFGAVARRNQITGNFSSSPPVVLPTNDDAFQLQHMWNCTLNNRNALNIIPEEERPKKLVFVHVFKTAGSTLRELFREYSAKCQAGLSIVVGCSGWIGSRPNTDGELVWQGLHKSKGFQAPCELKSHIYRGGKEGRNTPHHVKDEFVEKETDILAGHVSMGVHNGFSDKAVVETHNYQYVTFFRDAMSRFVSAFVFVNAKRGRELSEFQAIRGMKKKVWAHIQRGQYSEGYSPYLLFPDQKKSLLTVESRVKQIQQNMVDNNVMIGIVDKMDTSLDLLGHLIDKDREARHILDKLDPRVPKEKELHKNGSHLSTSGLVRLLQNDTKFVPIFTEYLKYDTELYEFALKMHERQVQATLGKTTADIHPAQAQ